MKGVYPVEIRFNDIDLAGHVHNSVYLAYFEQARMGYFNELIGADWDWRKQGLILARNEVDYLAPVYLKDRIMVSVHCDHIGTKSFALSYTLFSNDSKGDQIIHTKGRSILVCMDYEIEETVNIFPEWKDVLHVL